MITDDSNKFLKVVTDTYQNLLMKKENKLQELIHKHNHWPHFYREPMLAGNKVFAAYIQGKQETLCPTTSTLYSIKLPEIPSS